MSIVRKFQNNFTTGIISEGVSARSDLSKYASACRNIENGVVKAQGGITKRPGLEYIEELADLSGTESASPPFQPPYPLLIPFQYSEGQSSVIIMEDKKIRIHTDGEDDQEIDSPYSLYDLADLRFTQSADVLFFAHKEYAVRKLYREAVTNAETGEVTARWSIERMSFKNPNSFHVQQYEMTELGGHSYATIGEAVTIPITSSGGYNPDALDASKVWLKYAVSVVGKDGSESSPREAFCVPVKAVWESGTKLVLSWQIPGGNFRIEGFSLIDPATGEDVRAPWNGYWRKYSDSEYRFTTLDNRFLYLRRYPCIIKEPLESGTIGCLDSDTDSYNLGTIGTGGGSTSWTNGTTTLYTQKANPSVNTDYFYTDAARTTKAGKVKKKYNDYRYYLEWFWAITEDEYLPAYNTYQDGTHQETGSFPLSIRNAGLETYKRVVEQHSLGSPSVTYVYYYYQYYRFDESPLPEPFVAFAQDEAASFTRGNFTQELSTSTKFYSAPSAEVAHIEEGIAASNIDRYYVYKDVNGGFGYIGSVEEPGAANAPSPVRRFVDDYISPDYTTGLKNEKDPFGSEDGSPTNPSAVGIFQQRLVLAGTKENSQTVWMSESGAFNSFGVHSPLIGSDSIEVTIDSRKVNAIRHFVYVKNGLILTEGAEYIIGSGEQNGAVTPTSIRIAPQSYWGGSNIPPITIGTYVLFLENSGKTVRDFCYKYTEDSYIGEDMTVLADDILETPAMDWSYQQSPNSAVWVVCEDGSLKSLTYMRDQEVYAWARHSTNGGRFVSTCTVREKGKDRTYFIVRRGDVYNLERLALYEPSYGPADYCFLDSAVRLRNELSVTEFTDDRLARFNGKEVTVYAVGSGGASIFKTVVTGNSVATPYPSNIVVVGYPYTMIIETVDPEIKSEGGAVVGDKRLVTEASLILRKTAPGLKVGSPGYRMEEVKFRRDGESLPLKTGTVSLAVSGGYRETAEFSMVHDAPAPCTILGLMTKISVG